MIMKHSHFEIVGWVFIIFSIVIAVAMALTGCISDTITSVPDVSHLPVITKRQLRNILIDYNIKEKLLNLNSFSRPEYSIPTLEDVKDLQIDAWHLIGSSPYDKRNRNCVDFAEALKPILTWQTPTAPIGIVFYYGFCRIPDCASTKIYGHALLIFVTQNRKVVFIEPRQAGNIYNFDYDVVIAEIRI